MLRFKTDEGIEFPNCKRMKMKDIFVEIIDKKHPTMPVLSVQQGMGTILRDKSNRNINYNKTNLDSYKAMKKGDFIIHLRSFEGGLECSNYDGISSPAYKILRTNKLIPEAYKGYFRTYNFIEGKLSAAVVGIREWYCALRSGGYHGGRRQLYCRISLCYLRGKRNSGSYGGRCG